MSRRNAFAVAPCLLALVASSAGAGDQDEGLQPEAEVEVAPGVRESRHYQDPHYIDLLGSFVGPDSDRDTKSRGYGGTFIYGAHLDGPFWVEGRLQATLFETGSNAGTDFYHYGGGIDLVATLGDRTGWTPFGLVGAGGVYDDVQPDSRDSFEFRGDLGLGIVSPPVTSRGLKVRAEGRGLYDSFRSGQLDWQVSLGISIPLGYREVVERVVIREVVVREASPAPPDSDFDGVLDRIDQCPDTLAGGVVDATGCLLREQTVILRDVHFEFDSSQLTRESERRLDEIVAGLRLEPEVVFEIAGHTDSVGLDEYNDRLSQARALSVMRYLAGRGLESERMTARGYGERQPIDTNATHEGRARNRRVEFRFYERGSR